MFKETWKKAIISACKDANTYQPYFEMFIDELAEILSIRDDAIKKFAESGYNSVIEYTNTSGKTNLVKNPTLSVILELNQQALNYWRDLGLSPKGLKSLGEKVSKEEGNAFDDILSSLGI